jgi:hypothetical protein
MARRKSKKREDLAEEGRIEWRKIEGEVGERDWGNGTRRGGKRGRSRWTKQIRDVGKRE